MAMHKKKLLIVDDEKNICDFVKMLFRKKGFAVYSALSGREAIKITKRIKPDIALIDVHLKKGIDGFEVLRQMMESTSKCQSIMVTWDGAQEKIKAAEKIGAVAYLTKPLTTNELCKTVNRFAKVSHRKRGF